MKIQQYVKLTIAATFIGALSTHAKANSCGELSPLVASLGADYAAMTYSPEDTASDTLRDNDDLIALIEQTKLHTGHGVRVSCLGSTGYGEEVSSTFTLTDIDHRENSRGSIMLTASEESIEKRSRGVIELPKAQHWQVVSDNSYSTSYLFRLHNHANSGSRPAEMALTLSSHESGVVVTA